MKRFLAVLALFGCLAFVSACEDSTPKQDAATSKKAFDDANANLMKKSAEPVPDKDSEKSDDAAKADGDKAGDDEKAKEE
jgi:hypothetical protein